GAGRDLADVLGPEILQPGRSPLGKTIRTGLHPEGSRAGTTFRTLLANPAHAWHLGFRPGLRDHRARVLVLPVLAAAISEPAIQPGHQRDPNGYPADHHLPDR